MLDACFGAASHYFTMLFARGHQVHVLLAILFLWVFTKLTPLEAIENVIFLLFLKSMVWIWEIVPYVLSLNHLQSYF